MTKLNPDAVVLKPGLKLKPMHDELMFGMKLTDVGNRVLSYYLGEMQRRGLHNEAGLSSAAAYAVQNLGVASHRRAREFVQVGQALRNMPLLDGALADGRLGWSKVVILLRRVMVSTQEQWIDQAKDMTCKQLKAEVAGGVEFGNNGDGKKKKSKGGLTKPRFDLAESLDLEAYELLQEGTQYVTEKQGTQVKELDVIKAALRLLVGAGRQAASKAPAESTRVPSEAAPVEEAADVPRAEEDRATPAALRQKILETDGHCCVNCGRYGDLQAHHIVFLRHGGRTEESNLISLCGSCHALVHTGFLVIKGRAPDELQRLKRDGEPVKVEVKATAPAYQCAPGAAPDVVDTCDPPPTRPMFLSYEEIPDVASREWWDDHKHLFEWVSGPGLRMKIKRSALR